MLLLIQPPRPRPRPASAATPAVVPNAIRYPLGVLACRPSRFAASRVMTPLTDTAALTQNTAQPHCLLFSLRHVSYEHSM